MNFIGYISVENCENRLAADSFFENKLCMFLKHGVLCNYNDAPAKQTFYKFIVVMCFLEICGFSVPSAGATECVTDSSWTCWRRTTR